MGQFQYEYNFKSEKWIGAPMDTLARHCRSSKPQFSDQKPPRHCHQSLKWYSNLMRFSFFFCIYDKCEFEYSFFVSTLTCIFVFQEHLLEGWKVKNSEFEPLYLFRSLASFVLELSCHSGGEIDVVRFLLITSLSFLYVSFLVGIIFLLLKKSPTGA